MTEPSQLATTLRVVRINLTDQDPALDVEAMGARVDPADETSLSLLGRYIRDRDESDLRFREGQRPTWFHVKRLPAAYLTGVLDGIFPLADRLRAAVAASVHFVECADGTALRCVPKAQATRTDAFLTETGLAGVEIARPEWVQELVDRYGAELLAELGTVILTQSRLPRGKRGPFEYWGGTVLTR